MADLSMSHRETQTELPDPVEGRGLSQIWTFALPAVTLSVASAAAFVIALLILVRNPFFVLPRLAEAAIAAVAAALSWAVVLGGRRRPGSSVPRIWALGLAIGSALVACLVLALPGKPAMDAIAVAALAAAFTLAARLVRLDPSSVLVTQIAPLSLAGALLVVVPATWQAGQQMTKSHRAHVDLVTQELRDWAKKVRTITQEYDWKHLEADREGGEERVEQLAKLDFHGRLDDGELWQDAVALKHGKDEELAKSARELLDVVVAGLAPERVPRVSRFREPVVHYVRDGRHHGHWEANADFPALSATVGNYHRHLGRLMDELAVADLPLASQPLTDLRVHYRANEKLLARHMTAILDSWPDSWAVFRIPPHLRIRKDPLALSELFQAPVFSTEERPMAAGDLRHLMLLQLRATRRSSPEAAGCRPTEYPEENPGTRQVFNYFRLDCYSYSPREEDPGAELRVEMRLVYKSKPYRPLAEDSFPAEVFFRLPIPAGEAAYRDRVMKALAESCRQAGNLQYLDLGTSVTTGFAFRAGGAPVRVYPLPPSPDEPRMLQVRAYRP